MRWHVAVNGKLRPVLVVVFVVAMVVGVGLILKGHVPEKEKSLINISELSEEFMENYFDEVGEIASEDNLLIVTSMKGISDNYGASRMVETPNYQYVLQYESEEKKNAVREKFENDENVIGVDNNDEITLNDAGHNSWGIEKMALDGAIEVANAKSLPEVRVAVIDSGCDVDLVNKYYPGKITETYNALNTSTTDMYDSYGHGTHVAGIVAESTPTNVRVMPVKVGDGRTMKILHVVAALDYVTYYEKADVINMSFGLNNYNTALYMAIEAADQEGIVTVAAAGNDNTAQYAYPAAYDNTISIASVDAELRKSSFSNYNEMVDFAAPGTAIKSTLKSTMTIPQVMDGDDDFGVLNGTSMAAPHAAGVVAILKSYNKDLTRNDVIGLLTDYAVRDLGDVGKDVYYGNGLIYLRSGMFCADATEDECEKFGVFKTVAKIAVTGLEIQNGILTDKNYGTVNNLNPTRVEVTYSDGTALTASLGDLRGAEISGYDAEAKGAQTVVVEWRGQRAEFEITNLEVWENGWQYVATSETTAKLTGFVDFNWGYAAKTLYLPAKVDQYEINELAGATEGYTIFDYANKTTYEEVVLPASLAEISSSQVFRGFSALRKVVSLAPVLKITGGNVFSYLDNLAEVAGAVELMGEYSFAGDTALEKVTLAEGMTAIPASSFVGCSALEELHIPSSVEVIGAEAFGQESGHITIWTNSESYAKNYAVENKMAYEATNVVDVELATERREFRSFDIIESDVYVYFDRGVNEGTYKELKGTSGRREVIKAEEVSIAYPEGRESFRYGDEVFSVSGATRYGGRFEKAFAVTVSRKEIDCRSEAYEGVYDGNEHSIKVEVGLDDYEIRYAVNGTDYALTERPVFAEAGEYTVNYKVSAEGYDDTEGSSKVKIYGVKDFGGSVVLKDNKLVVQDNDFEKLKGEIVTYAASIELEHYDKNGEAATGVLKTGDVVKVVLNGTLAYEFRAAVAGDTTGDGKVSYLDYVNVYNHIQKVKNPALNKVLLMDEYLLAADVSGDGKVNYLDYVKVYNKIKDQKGRS